MLSVLIEKALGAGCILDYPGEVVMIGFFLRADLAMLADLPEYKTELTNVGGKIATTKRPVQFELLYRRKSVERLMADRGMVVADCHRRYHVPVAFIDVAKHAPEGVKLAKLGELLGLSKMELPPGYSITRLDELLRKDRQAFMDYGIRDAEIATKYYLQVLEFARKEIWFDASHPEKSLPRTLPVSAGALAVQLCKKTLKDSGLDFAELFGLTRQTRTTWDPVKYRFATVETLEQSGMRQFHEGFAAQCYHGGRNETFCVGPTLAGRWHDFDLVGAYTTGLVSIREIDYAASFETKRIEDFLGDVMGFAWVKFKYPEDVRYPALPVRNGDRGLFFPRAGESFATAPEIALAISQGAQIVIKRGVVYPWKAGGEARIFAPFVREIRRMRGRYPKGSVPEQTAKLHGNSLYGKTGQGLREKSVFDTHALESRKVGHSRLTNAPMTSHTTGSVRAVMGEIMHRLPEHRTILSVTTDGILSDAEPEELDLSGPLCQRYLQLCALVQE